jgi:hypothetical protein
VSQPDPSTIATASLAAHLLAEGASAVIRGRDLLEFLSLPDDADAIQRALTAASRQIQAARQIVDGHLDAIVARAAGREPDPDALALVAIGRSELER